MHLTRGSASAPSSNSFGGGYPFAFQIGLSVELPVTLALFSDALIVCTRQSASHHHHTRCLNLLFKCKRLVATDTQDLTKAPTFQVDCIQSLPEGWQQTTETISVVPPMERRLWVNAALQVTQEEPPENYVSVPSALAAATAAEAAVGAVTFLAASEVEKSAWLHAFTTATKFIPVVVNLEKKKKSFEYFGKHALDDILAHDRALQPGVQIPILVKRILHHLISNGLKEEGIFRLAADMEQIENVKKQIDEGKLLDLNLSSIDVHVLSGILKQFLRELPSSLLPDHMFKEFTAVAEEEPDKIVSQLAALIEGVPFNERVLLREVFAFLYQIACNNHVNHMTFENLSIVVAPNILKTPVLDPMEQLVVSDKVNSVVSAMLKDYTLLFKESKTADSVLDFVTFKRKLFGHERSVSAIAHVPSLGQVWSIDSSGVFYQWNAETCLYNSTFTIKDVQTRYATCMMTQASHDDEVLWVGSQTNVVIVNVATREVIKQIATPVFCMISVGDEVWCGTDNCVLVFDSKSYEKKDTLELSNVMVMCMAQTGDSVWVAGNKQRCADQEIHVYDRETHEKRHSFKAHLKKINALCVVRGSTVWSCSDDGTICIWDAASYTRLDKLVRHEGIVYNLAVLGKYVWSCGWDKKIMIWHAKSYRRVAVLQGYHTDAVSTILPIVSSVVPSSAKEDASEWHVWSAAHDTAVCVWEVNASRLNLPRYRV
eukprot:TRINITY_DN4289_c0_g1_i2.p1 TRINITY_DN4289_c0_g1~~TRINITY_DN4289_c0_g1_i2.p1  ORF type:complete len:729 (-),score=169.87 TRINITY_DN4289_c0_g1_i2:88-2226(-)